MKKIIFLLSLVLVLASFANNSYAALLNEEGIYLSNDSEGTQINSPYIASGNGYFSALVEIEGEYCGNYAIARARVGYTDHNDVTHESSSGDPGTTDIYVQAHTGDTDYDRDASDAGTITNPKYIYTRADVIHIGVDEGTAHAYILVWW